MREKKKRRENEMRKNYMSGLEMVCRRFTMTSKAIFLIVLFVAVVFSGIFVSRFLLISKITVIGPSPGRVRTTRPTYSDTYTHKTGSPHPLNCTEYGLTGTCPSTYEQDHYNHHDHHVHGGNPPISATCPEYFRWIHEDLRPWAREGISRATLERARTGAEFRLVIVNGRAYVERYRKAFQTRDVFTLWGVLQLLRRYPGKVLDLELMFDCTDWPEFDNESDGGFSGANASSVGVPPPPLFRYCGRGDAHYVVFPDWTFWGWPEINVKPWEGLLKDLREGNERSKWVDREPYAYWRGNPYVSAIRHQLMRCNISYKQKHDWNVRLYTLNWAEESGEGYKKSNLGSQCNHRYKIYVEGRAWSVSGKYILACDSPTLYVKTQYYDFFTRSLMPMHHYWPIRDDDQCKSIKFAVDWGTIHKQKAQEIGRAASEFIQEEVKMDYVYDYMLHLLNQYAKLLKFKPTVPQNAVELCSEAMACPAEGLERKFMKESMLKGPSDKGSCNLPPPYDTLSLNALIRRKSDLIKQVEMWETSYWKNHKYVAM